MVKQQLGNQPRKEEKENLFKYCVTVLKEIEIAR